MGKMKKTTTINKHRTRTTETDEPLLQIYGLNGRTQATRARVVKPFPSVRVSFRDGCDNTYAHVDADGREENNRQQPKRPRVRRTTYALRPYTRFRVPARPGHTFSRIIVDRDKTIYVRIYKKKIFNVPSARQRYCGLVRRTLKSSKTLV